MTIGTGTIDVAGVLGGLGRVGFSGPLIIELFEVPKKLVSHRRLLALLAWIGPGRPRADAEGRRGRRTPREALSRRGPSSRAPARRRAAAAIRCGAPP
jgi:sugar phosphate isomerase/epimerase